MIDRVTEEYFTEDFAAYKTEKEDGNKEKPRCTAIILAAGAEAGCTPQWRNSSFR
ncbi:MAG: hypothetical protein ACLT95_11375 [Waltera sp.]|uniref:hypothetical protein n=1 Tax=Waltera sp. TaxID=2815806 RepID=UPI0039919144